MAVVYNQRQRNNPFAPNPTKSVPDQLAKKLGSGLLVPLTIVNNAWLVASGLAKVRQDIFVTLATSIGSRLNRLDFGSLLPMLIFEDWGPNLQQELIVATQTALQTWNTNIIVNTVTIDDSNINQNYLTLNIQYMLRGTNATDTVSIVLTSAVGVQLPPSTFTINGVQVLRA
jgi:phage baseplate assembly protein W